jgi:hypothetical protein
MSVATEESLIPASSSSFSSRSTVRERSRVMWVRARVRSPQRPNRWRRHERRRHQPVRPEIGQPRSIRHIRLICGLTGNIVQPGSTETPLQDAASTALAAELSADPWQRKRLAGIFAHHDGSEARQRS